jgi:hypothetical protein
MKSLCEASMYSTGWGQYHSQTTSNDVTWKCFCFLIRKIKREIEIMYKKCQNLKRNVFTFKFWQRFGKNLVYKKRSFTDFY